MRKTGLREAKSLARDPTAGLGFVPRSGRLRSPSFCRLLSPLLELRFPSGQHARGRGHGGQRRELPAGPAGTLSRPRGWSPHFPRLLSVPLAKGSPGPDSTGRGLHSPPRLPPVTYWVPWCWSGRAGLGRALSLLWALKFVSQWHRPSTGHVRGQPTVPSALPLSPHHGPEAPRTDQEAEAPRWELT